MKKRKREENSPIIVPAAKRKATLPMRTCGACKKDYDVAKGIVPRWRFHNGLGSRQTFLWDNIDMNPKGDPERIDLFWTNRDVGSGTNIDDLISKYP